MFSNKDYREKLAQYEERKRQERAEWREEAAALAKAQDMVNHPKHYTKGGIETIDFMKAKLSPEGYQGYLAGNVIKYITRYPDKNGLEDLKKAQTYLNWLIRELENND